VASLPAGLLDRPKGIARLVGVAVEYLLRGTGLHDHDADAVRNDVVQLSGDAGALVRGRLARLFLTFDLQANCAVEKLVRALLAGTNRSAG
jgi:hypothetical protein